MAKVKTGETERGNGGREIDRIEETAGTGTTRREGNGPEINERVSKMGVARLWVAPGSGWRQAPGGIRADGVRDCQTGVVIDVRDLVASRRTV